MSSARLLIGLVFLLGAALIASSLGVYPAAAQGNTPPSPAASPQAPATQITEPTIPAAVAVELDPATTAYLVLDFTSVICAPRPSCMSLLPATAALLQKARSANVAVIYSDTPDADSTILAEVTPTTNEPTVTGRADKFFGTNLDDLLKQKGIQTVVLAGYAANGAVLYTTFAATARGYTVVVAEDAMGSEDPYALPLTRYQVLNQPGLSNPQNKSLEPGRVTLSRTDLITFASSQAAQPAATATEALTTAPADEQIVDLDAIFPPGQGRDFVLESCMNCHTFVPLVVLQMTKEEWDRNALDHRERVPGVSDEDYAALYEYLAANFNPNKPVPHLPQNLLDTWTSY